MHSKRSNYIKSQKVVSAILVSMVALSSGTAAFADEVTPTTSTATVTSSSLFNDVKNGYWAEKHIYKLASQGIILGDKGLFRPNDSVTQQEAITMAIRFMGLQDSLNSSNTSTLPANLTVGNYFKPYVDLAFQKNLLDKKLEMDDATLKTSWGQKQASREWITQILVRAIGKQDEATSANKATAFADNSKISASKLGYVNVAVELGLTNGTTGNRFDPQGSVTRTQLATFFSRAEAHSNTQYANASEGIVTSINNDTLSLYVNGKILDFSLDNKTAYFTSTSDTKVALSDVKLYTKVMVLANTGKASYVEITDPKEQLDSIDTTFERMFPGNMLGVSNNTSFDSYKYDANTIFLDQNNNKIEPSALTAGSQIVIKRENVTSDKNVIVVQIKSGVINKSSNGTLQNVDVANKTVAIKNASGSLESYTWDDSSIIRYQTQILTPADLKSGSEVKYTVKNNVIQIIEVTQAVEHTVRGAIYQIGANNSTITYKKEGGSLEVKLLVDKPVIEINGIAKPVFTDLIADTTGGDQVELTLNPQEQVTKIVVINRQMEQKPDSSVVSYDAKTKLLTILDANKKPFVVTLDENTKLSYNTTTPTLSGIEPLLTNNRRINLNYISNRALSIEVLYKYEGTLYAMDTSARKLTILLANGQTVTKPYISPIIEIFGKSSSSISDVKIGDPVTVVMTDNQDNVKSILVRSSKQYEVTSIDQSSGRVMVKADSLLSQIYLDKAVIVGDGGQISQFSNLQVGNIINVSFNGYTPATAQVVKLLTGEVLTIDAAAQNVTVKNYNGSSETYKVQGAFKIVRDGQISTNLNSLLPTDRVEIRKDVDGSTTLKVLSTTTRDFWKYDSASREVFLKTQSTSEKNRFTLSPNAYIHQGDTVITVQSLKENDNIVVYFNNDIIVEIQKR
ncbi:S-layer homology domain-containing protein [Paenibacillus sp. IHBB 10380]|uniref:S-layer homology domain-containing protein n=1 Tax=Paenibacillus sp. IHBB 10380 TaxID=1566358 RepID=UPI0005CFD82F|nr:S-layer homology domain-containing protein [Paenibacillus sp. IHBB 10380]AJS58114.1 S-layer protein [Paenibacillus sp. IHBB 10380]